MKNSIKLFAIALIATVTVSTSSFASNEKTINDTAVAVDVEAKKDWILLAKQSEYLMNRNSHLSTAKVWLEESLEIKETAYNLELMGDLHFKNNEGKQAIIYYIKAMEALKTENPLVDTASLQDKIVQAKN